MGCVNDEGLAENNKFSQPGEIDLHGLFVKEAIEFSDKGIEDAQRRGDSELRLIVGSCSVILSGSLYSPLHCRLSSGKGNHSLAGQAKIKPAIEELMRKSVVCRLMLYRRALSTLLDTNSWPYLTPTTPGS